MKAIHHIAYYCKDKKTQEAFYTKHFGFYRARVFNEGKPDEFAQLRLGPVCIELFDAPEEATAADKGGPQRVGYVHLAFEVSDIETAVAELVADGIECERIIKNAGGIEGMHICFFNDPEGNRVELMQGARDQYPAPEAE